VTEDGLSPVQPKNVEAMGNPISKDEAHLALIHCLLPLPLVKTLWAMPALSEDHLIHLKIKILKLNLDNALLASSSAIICEISIRLCPSLGLHLQFDKMAEFPPALKCNGL
jgi:hypothetical protein